jgi:hypothetical protein
MRNIFVAKKNKGQRIFEMVDKKCLEFLIKNIHFFLTKNVALSLIAGKSDAHHTSQENES